MPSCSSRQAPHPECYVDAAFQQINVFIVENNVDVEFRVLIKKCLEPRKDVNPRKGHRC